MTLHDASLYDVGMDLLERDGEIGLLRDSMHGALVGVGRVVAVTGESGAGKTSLVRAVCREFEDARMVRGVCDPLSTPRPLGPIRDIMGDLELPPPDPTDRSVSLSEIGEDVFAAAGAVPTVVVVEDAQWIDEASVDVLRFLVRRLEAVPVVLLLVYRHDEISTGHPLRPLLGDLARLGWASTMRVPPLSLDAVATLLEGASLDPATVLQLTGGNAFFVSEIARHAGEGLPSSVRDAVLASTDAVDLDDLEVLQLIATAPDGLDDRLLPLLDVDVPTLRRLDATGLLVHTRRGVGFRHELARLAIEDSIPLGADVSMHGRILDALERLGSRELAVLAHHAHAARDAVRTSRYASEAADEAARTGSHTEAVAFLRLAIDQFDAGPPLERAALLDRLSLEQYMVNRLPEAIDSISIALQLRREAGDSDGLAAAHARRALIEYYSARRTDAEFHSRRAAEVALEGGSGRTSGTAHFMRAYLALRQYDFDRAAGWEGEARRVAHEHDDASLRLQCEIVEAAAGLISGTANARESMLMSIDSAISNDYDEVASMGMSNIIGIDVEERRFRAAEEMLSKSLPFTVERDIPICNSWQTAMHARLQFARGRWEAALEDADLVLEGGGAPLARVWPHLVAGLVAMRRGEAQDHLDVAWALSEDLDEPLVRMATLSALAEGMWLTGCGDARLLRADAVLAGSAAVPGLRFAAGDLATWLHRMGRPVDPTLPVAEPFRLGLDGRAREAAAWWRRTGAPFEEALALVASDDADDQVAGIEALDLLGAAATADRCRMDLRRRGVVHLPARPRASTRANPAGLTNRQLDVARLMAQGLTNAELAQRLYISAKTADHHVSAVLSKLGLASRRDVVRRAAEFGLD